jgi:hypothetical protein
MDMMETVNSLLPYIMSFVMIFVIYIMARKLIGNMGMKKPTDLPPSSTGDRLKKYLYNARKGNPKTVKTIQMKRSPYNTGGFVGHCVGVLPTRYCTRFIFKRNWWQRWNYQLLYCPTSMHTSLHSANVMISGVGLDNAGGFYYPIPADNKSNYDAFEIISNAIKIDLKKMQIIDTMQVSYDQVMSAIAGEETKEEFVTGAPETMVQQQQPSQNISVEEGED